MLGNVVEGLAWIGHGGWGEHRSWMMRLRWWWPWGSFSQSGSRKMMAGGGDKMVGPLGCLSDCGGGFEVLAGGSGEEMGADGHGELK